MCTLCDFFSSISAINIFINKCTFHPVWMRHSIKETDFFSLFVFEFLPLKWIVSIWEFRTHWNLLWQFSLSLSLCGSNGALCQCGGARENHASITAGDHVVSQWDSVQHTSEYPTDAFGQLEFAGAGRRNSPVGISLSFTPAQAHHLTMQYGQLIVLFSEVFFINTG